MLFGSFEDWLCLVDWRNAFSNLASTDAHLVSWVKFWKLNDYDDDDGLEEWKWRSDLRGLWGLGGLRLYTSLSGCIRGFSDTLLRPEQRTPKCTSGACLISPVSSNDLSR